MSRTVNNGSSQGQDSCSTLPASDSSYKKASITQGQFLHGKSVPCSASSDTRYGSPFSNPTNRLLTSGQASSSRQPSNLQLHLKKTRAQRSISNNPVQADIEASLSQYGALPATTQSLNLSPPAIITPTTVAGRQQTMSHLYSSSSSTPTPITVGPPQFSMGQIRKFDALE